MISPLSHRFADFPFAFSAQHSDHNHDGHDHGPDELQGYEVSPSVLEQRLAAVKYRPVHALQSRVKKDPQAQVHYARIKQVCSQPRVFHYKSFMTAEEADYIVALGGTKLERSMTVGPNGNLLFLRLDLFLFV